jgi:glutamyl-tRNA reductase
VYLYAITHKNTPLNLIGDLKTITEEVYVRLHRIVNGVFVLATCNRFEVYIDVAGRDDIDDIENILSDIIRDAWSYVVKLKGLDAVRHLFRVASGLESQIIGEHEILRQVKDAWLKAKADGYTSKLLDIIIHRALLTGKRSREETKISHGAIGYPQAAIELLSKKINGLDSKTIMIIGAGHAAEKALKYLCSRYKPEKVIIINRSIDKAMRVAKICRNSIIAGLEERYKYLNIVDGIFIAVSGNVKIFNINDITKTKAIVVDISTPSVIDSVDGQTYSINDVKKFSEENIFSRLQEIPKVETIIENEIRKLKDYIIESEAKIVISKIMILVSDLYEREIRKALKYYEKGEPIELLLRKTLNSYTKKVMRPFIIYMKNKAANGDQSTITEIYSYFTKELNGEVS